MGHTLIVGLTGAGKSVLLSLIALQFRRYAGSQVTIFDKSDSARAAVLGVGTELTLGSDESDLVRAIRQSTQQNVNRAGQRITEKNLDIQPTITVRPGWLLRFIVHRDLVLRPYQG